jgi:Domain of unknown function (DUF4388)
VRVSLQGTFDTLSVTELFGLLSTAAKTGALRLEAGGGEASVFVSQGRCCGVDADETMASAGSNGPAGSEAELARRLTDVGFAFARRPDGSFRFTDSEVGAHDCAITAALEPVIVEIGSMLDQWREIESTIPSLDARVRIAPVLGADEIILSAAEWGLLMALESGPTVRDLVARRAQPMLDVCRELLELVERGAVEVGPEVEDGAEVEVVATPVVAVPEPVGEVRPDRHHRTAPVVEPTEPYAPEAQVEVAAPAAGLNAVAAAADAIVAAEQAAPARPTVPEGLLAAAETEEASGAGPDAAQDRGALLRLFSALKE